MQAKLQENSQQRFVIALPAQVKSMGRGLISGLIATLVMDLILMGLLTAAGLPAFTCYAIVGNTIAPLFALSGITSNASIALGIAAHFAIGPLMGGIFGGAMTKFHFLRQDSRGKVIICAILFAEILSQPMLALTPILLKMAPSETLQWYGGSFGMHLIWACVLGLVWNSGK